MAHIISAIRLARPTVWLGAFTGFARRKPVRQRDGKNPRRVFNFPATIYRFHCFINGMPNMTPANLDAARETYRNIAANISKIMRGQEAATRHLLRSEERR